MLKAKVLGKDIEIDDDGSVKPEDETVFGELVKHMMTEVDTSQGMVIAGTGDLLEIIVLLNLVDEDFEIVSSDDEDAELTKRLVQEGDVLES